MGSMSVESLAIAIGEMRRSVRRRHVDIRANTRVMKALHQWLSSHASKKRQTNEQVAAEDYNGEAVDYRERRALKRSRQSEEADPSFLGDALARDAVDPERNTRNKVQKLDAARDESVRQRRLSVPISNVARPPPNSMDAVPIAYRLPNAAANLFTQAYSTAQGLPSQLPVSYLICP